MKLLSLRASAPVIAVLGLFSCIAGAQVTGPGGVHGSSVWYSRADGSELVGNHHSFDLLRFEDSLQYNLQAVREASTYFFVLKPRFDSAAGSEFMTVGTVRIFDDRVEYGMSEKALDFTNKEPVIISVVAPQPHRYGRCAPVKLEVSDSSLFEVAEVLLFPDRLSRFEIHKVDTYLALKYSIAITQNTEARWRNYHKADSTLYWSTAVDQLFDQRVIGLGRSSDENFYQTQTATSSGTFLQISLDTPVALGQMPPVVVGEDAFLVFSERNPLGQGNPACPLNNNVGNPMRNWKFKLHNWVSPAEHLIIRVEKPKGQLADSLFLFDGNQHWHLPQTVIDSVVEYKVYFDMLNNDLHYFFTETRSNPCDVVQLTQNGTSIMVNNPDGDDITVTSQSMKTGVTVTETTSLSVYERGLDEGQHIIQITDENGNTTLTQVVRVLPGSGSRNADLRQPDIRVYPNPSVANKQLTLSAEGLPSDSPVAILLSDASGKILKREEMPYSDYLEYRFSLPVSGNYQITLFQEGISYSLKVVIVE